MHWIVVAVGVVVALVLAAGSVHLLLTWANRRGLVWYRDDERPPSQSLGLIEEIYHPSAEHVVEYEAGEAARADHADTTGPENLSDTDR